MWIKQRFSNLRCMIKYFGRHEFCFKSESKAFTKDELNKISLYGTVYESSVDHSAIEKGWYG